MLTQVIIYMYIIIFEKPMGLLVPVNILQCPDLTNL